MRILPKVLRLRSVQPGVCKPIASIQHGYLWIGPENGPCLVVIAGPRTLKTLGRMLLRYVR